MCVLLPLLDWQCPEDLNLPLHIPTQGTQHSLLSLGCLRMHRDQRSVRAWAESANWLTGKSQPLRPRFLNCKRGKGHSCKPRRSWEGLGNRKMPFSCRFCFQGQPFMPNMCLHLGGDRGLPVMVPQLLLHLCEWRISYCYHLIKNICIWAEHLESMLP